MRYTSVTHGPVLGGQMHLGPSTRISGVMAAAPVAPHASAAHIGDQRDFSPIELIKGSLLGVKNFSFHIAISSEKSS